MAHAAAPTKIAELATIAIPVSDQDRALEFYTERLGFRKTMDYTFGASRWIEVSPGGGTATIALAPAGPGQKPGIDTGIRLSTTDARGDHEAMKSAGIEVDDVLEFGAGVPPMFIFRDRDGNRLVVVEQPPRS